MVEKRLSKIEEKIEKISRDLERAKIAEYADIVNNPRRLLYLNFIGGLARGLGTAIGLTILAAIFFYILKQTVDLPLIGKYIAELIEIIENHR
ncbi:hypothetical protein FQB35_06150 [Crassaminicella thermophila]|uniref:Signal transduction histidine kinase n=1 Tax=Crassaminicella thermophila TaxID=2599308 RepID=A0A5C0SF96_CRATE|nr:DUF5665 domain-containing protein [Crassaminicella thermophila]QEK11984.1 hypothetical protein FQB35_06150 [Crassaminicella thermophila]